MNWETYNTLTKEQKEEFNYKYNNKPGLDIKGTLNAVTFFLLTISVFVTMLAFVMSSGKLPEIEPHVESYMESLTDVVKILVPLTIGYLLYSVGSMTWYHISERKWRNVNNIKNKGKWWHK